MIYYRIFNIIPKHSRILLFIHSVCSLLSLLFSHSVVGNSLRPYGLQHIRLPCSSLSISRSLFKLMSIELVMLFNHLILYVLVDFKWVVHPIFQSMGLETLKTESIHFIKEAKLLVDQIRPVTFWSFFTRMYDASGGAEMQDDCGSH